MSYGTNFASDNYDGQTFGHQSFKREPECSLTISKITVAGVCEGKPLQQQHTLQAGHVLYDHPYQPMPITPSSSVTAAWQTAQAVTTSIFSSNRLPFSDQGRARFMHPIRPNSCNEKNPAKRQKSIETYSANVVTTTVQKEYTAKCLKKVSSIKEEPWNEPESTQRRSISAQIQSLSKTEIKRGRSDGAQKCQGNSSSTEVLPNSTTLCPRPLSPTEPDFKELFEWASLKSSPFNEESTNIDKSNSTEVPSVSKATTMNLLNLSPIESDFKPLPMLEYFTGESKNIENHSQFEESIEEAARKVAGSIKANQTIIENTVDQKKEKQADEFSRKLIEIEITLPKEIMLPNYCKLCEATLNDPMSARKHYDGKRHALKENQYIRKIYEAKVYDAARFFSLSDDEKQKQMSEKNKPVKKKSFLCAACGVSFKTQFQKDFHVTFCDGVKKEMVDKEIKKITKLEQPTKTNDLFCKLCGKLTNSPQQYVLHLASKKHKNKEKGLAEFIKISKRI